MFKVGDIVIPIDDVSDNKHYGFVVSTYTVYNEEVYNVLWFGEGTEYPYYYNEITKAS